MTNEERIAALEADVAALTMMLNEVAMRLESLDASKTDVVTDDLRNA